MKRTHWRFNLDGMPFIQIYDHGPGAVQCVYDGPVNACPPWIGESDDTADRIIEAGYGRVRAMYPVNNERKNHPLVVKVGALIEEKGE